MSILTVENASHSYGDHIIFQNLSFRVLRGEHIGLVGRNGAGKSTLLRMLAGEILPDSGNIDWHPRVKAGYLQQHIDLQSSVTIMEYLQGAYVHLFEIEKTMLQVTELMAQGSGDLGTLLTRYASLQSQLEQADFYSLQAKIEEVASGLGLAELGLNRTVEKLSGGQRTKLLLAKLLLEEPDVLLLDEPTNYLDDMHIAWLTDYLKRYEHAYVVVSHDERFLNEITNVIFHLEQLALKRFTGNFASFVNSYEQNKRQLQNAYEKQQQEIDRLESFIQKNKVRKAKQAKSREKVLARMNRIKKPPASQKPRFDFTVCHHPANRIIVANDLQIGYTVPLFGPIEIRVRRGEKIAMIGHNGIGKSTMLKTLLGMLPPLHGNVSRDESVKCAYFAQTEIVSSLTPLEQLWCVRPDLTQKEIRQALGRSGLTDQHIRQSLSTLSGGEQAKVRLCELMLTTSNVLVLDEPTNHLDVPAKEAFKDALMKYEGTILLVSHEPAFYEEWVTDVWNVHEWNK